MTRQQFRVPPPQNESSGRARRRLWPALLFDPGLIGYNLIALLAFPLFLWRKWRPYRQFNQDFHFDPARWTSRYGNSTFEADDETPSGAGGLRVMFITLGWGEVVSVEELALALQRERPGTQLLFSVRNREAIAAASQLSDAEVFPLPFDSLWPTARWLQRARPDVVVFYERFQFSCLLRALHLTRVPFLIIHARMRRSESRSKLNVAYKKWELRGLRDMCIPMEQYRRGVEQLLPPGARAHVTGSIKFPHSSPKIDPLREEKLRAWIEKGRAGAPLLVAGSTHRTEEDFVLDAFEEVRRQTPPGTVAPVLLIAPRHVSRGDDVAGLIRARGLRVARRSQGDSAEAFPCDAFPCDVLLLDTLGELACAYQFATGTFVGGTVYGDSHNIAEPLIWGVPVAYGPRRGNFENEQRICEGAGVGFRVASSAELATHWTLLLASSPMRDELREKIGALIAAQRGAFERILTVLLEVVDSAVAGKNRDN